MKSTHHSKADRRGPGRWPVVAAAVPVIMMAGAWSAAVAQTSSGDDTLAAGQRVSVPDVPSAESSTPLVVTTPTTTPPGATTPVVPAVDTSAQDVPVATLAAYKRAQTVLAASDAACRLPWNLVAAIGKVESNHGRYGGNVVGADGVSRPGVRGIALDGTNNTARILDSDSGALDGDATYDRAVGPMQFIPSTWAAVAVDGNGDGVKNPQDVNDAAVSAGVYLCAGGADLSTPAGARSAVLRYNQSGPYADTVLAISARYAAGDFTPAPGSSNVPVDTTPASPAAPVTPAEVTTPGKGLTEVAAAALQQRPNAPVPTTPGLKPATPKPTTPPATTKPPVVTPPPTDETTAPPAQETTPPPTDGTTAPPAEETTPPPTDETTAPPVEETTPPPTEESTPPPVEETTEPPADECDGVTVTESTETAGDPASGSCVPPCEDGTEPGADVQTPCAIVAKP
ncbi:lytic transglycosylase domain-containing protein [Solicola sp. PLA-1-18]|uniref:lytic transglycosylase domain-containing protein n=1 Tax=Solicola sp. PLA-1-18 TaxID=3380532 RepID=UPI003B79FFA8